MCFFVTRGTACIVPSLREGEVGDSAGKGDGTVSRFTCFVLSFPLCRTALACRPQQQPGGGGADASGPAGSDPSFIHPSSSIFSLFCVFFLSFSCALRVSFRAAAAEGKWWWHRQLLALRSPRNSLKPSAAPPASAVGFLLRPLPGAGTRALKGGCGRMRI